jgi:hypothetical protein
MSATKAPVEPGKVAETLTDVLREAGLGIGDLVEPTDLSYEHARRIVRGESVPSLPVLRLICNFLGLNFEEMKKLAMEDSLRRKYGDVPIEMAGKNPEMDPIERAWPHLTKKQKATVVTMVKDWAKANRLSGGIPSVQ